MGDNLFDKINLSFDTQQASWNKLIEEIVKGNVIPVIGPDILIDDGNIHKLIVNDTIYYDNGTKDILHLNGVYVRTINDKYLVEGYFYLKSKVKGRNISDTPLSIYLFSGEIDRKWSSEGFKNYNFEGKNFIGNNIDILGTYKKTSGAWTGELSSPVGMHAIFPPQKK